jgi:nickel/cobalt transporter (NicO) family protein
VTIASTGGPILGSSPSLRLTAYPKDLLTQPLSIRAVAFTASSGGPVLPALVIPDADALAQAGQQPSPAGVGRPGDGAGLVADPASAAGTSDGAVPGGVGSGDLPSIFRQTDLSPTIWLLAIATAVVLGAGHALTPGHGKTLMAAYLVGTRGTSLHAAGLGLSVTVSHTIGILVLAALVVGAQGLLPPDVVARTTPTVAALAIVAIGGWMLVSEIRRRRAATGGRGHGHHHGHDHDHQTGVDHQQAESVQHPESVGDADHSQPPGKHAHGAIAHTHAPPSGSTITWRGLFLLGLAGGIIPSTNALLILLGTIAAGRAAFGIVLVVAFGLGMALVMAGVGLALVHARGWLERGGSPLLVRRLSAQAPLVAAVLITGLGLWLTVQAVGRPAL